MHPGLIIFVVAIKRLYLSAFPSIRPSVDPSARNASALCPAIGAICGRVSGLVIPDIFDFQNGFHGRIRDR